MATINYSGNTYAGEVLEDLLVYTAQGNDTFKEGLIHIKPGVQKKFTLPHVRLGSIIQANNPTPTSTDGAAGEGGKNTYTFSERYLEPKDFMVYLEFNPRDFEDYWRFAQPEGELIFRDLDPKVQATMLRLLIDKKDQYIGDSIWAAKDKDGAFKSVNITSPSADCTTIGGMTSAGSMEFFDGALIRMIDDAVAPESTEGKSGEHVLLSGNAKFDGENPGEKVELAMRKMWEVCPKNVRKSEKLKFIMGWEAWDLYENYLADKQVKYHDNTGAGAMRFKGKQIVVISNMPEHTIVLGKFDSSMESNLWMGVDYATDQESVKVERLQANSELYFFQMRMKMDVNIVLPGEIVIHTAYKKATA